MVWEINMEVCPRLDFENIMLFNCLGYNFNIYGAFEFLSNSIANLRRHELRGAFGKFLAWSFISVTDLQTLSCFVSF